METQVNVSGSQIGLTKAQEAVLKGLPESLKGAVQAEFLKANALRDANRNQFSLSVGKLGALVIRGLGNRFPTGLYYNQIETIVTRWPEIQAFYNAHRAEIEAAVKNAPNVRKERKALSLVKK